MIKTAFDAQRFQWQRNTVDQLPKHDLFFGTPVNTSFAGFPIGDGDMGSLLWLEKDGFHIHVNKCDLWNDAPAGVTPDDEIFCSGRDEALTSLRHGGEITVGFDCPIFEYLYQKDFSARLSLSDATVRINAETPFGALTAKAFADAKSHTSVLRIELNMKEGVAPQLRLARWGSRNLWRWYAQQKFAPSTGLDGTEAFADGNLLFITQELNASCFCIGLAVESAASVSCSERINAHVCGLRLQKDTKQRFTLYYSIALGADRLQAKESCRKRLLTAVSRGANALYDDHKTAWETFWNRSFVSLPDDYVENIWYLYLYYMNSESRGAYPPHFTCGLWGAYHDFIPWNYYFHYNMQHLYAPLGAAGHGELAENYYAMRRAGLDTARLYAKRVKKAQGAFYHDVSDRFGRCADYDSDNCTPGAQIAMQMYRHWRYTGDETFLNDTVLPVMKGAAAFYLSILQKEDDGYYHIHGTTAYEGNRPTDDTLTDLVMVRALFTAYSAFADASMKTRIHDVLSALPPPVTLPLSPEDWDGETFTRGIGTGRKPYGDKTVFSAGLRDGAPVRIMKKEPEYGFPDIELCPLYPAGIFGLKDRGTPLFDTMRNQILLGSGTDMQWSMYPVYLARMGMADELQGMVRTMLDLWQRFPNGMGCEAGMVPAFNAAQWNHVKNVETQTVTKMSPEPFAHFDFETVPIIAQSVNDALLQSHEGVLRLCPAVKKTDSVALSLYAQGGFLVTAEVGPDGVVATVENLHGEDCFLILPAHLDPKDLFFYLMSDGVLEETKIRSVKKGRENTLDLCCKKGDCLLISSVPKEELRFCPPEKAPENRNMKECGRACLGSPRLPK